MDNNRQDFESNAKEFMNDKKNQEFESCAEEIINDKKDQDFDNNVETKSNKNDPKKNKKVFVENELSLGRWICTILLAAVFSLVFVIILGVVSGIIEAVLMVFPVSKEFEIIFEFVSYMITFVAFYFAFVLALKLVGKTSLKAFVLGADHKAKKVNVKTDVLAVLGLYLLAMIVFSLFTIKNTALTGSSPKATAVALVVSLLLVWMQTSWEELIFRGIPLRFFCKNEIGMNRTSWIVAIVTSVLFMLAHIPNPEVQNLSGISQLFMIAQYGIAGLGFFLCDMLAGSLLPGLLLHWMNNFFCFAIIDADISVMKSISIFTDHTPLNGVLAFVNVVFLFTPVVIYLVIRYKKRS